MVRALCLLAVLPLTLTGLACGGPSGGGPLEPGDRPPVFNTFDLSYDAAAEVLRLSVVANDPDGTRVTIECTGDLSVVGTGSVDHEAPFRMELSTRTAVVTCSARSGGRTAGPLTESVTIPAIDLSGTWSGAASDGSGPGLMTWELEHEGTSIEGLATRTESGFILFTGDITGSLFDSGVVFEIEISVGGMPGFPSCSASIEGEIVLATNDRLEARYTVTSTCPGLLTNGSFTLTRE